MAERLRLELLSSRQREQLFFEYASQEHRKELENLSHFERIEFQRLVSKKQQERLVQIRVDALKYAYKRRLIKSGISRLKSPNDRRQKLNKVEQVAQRSLAKEYLEFRKKEEARNEYKKKESEKDFLGTKPPKSKNKFQAWYYGGTASEEFQLKFGIKPHQVTPAGAVAEIQFIADVKRAKAEKLFKEKENQLTKTGVKITSEKSEALRKEAYNEICREWEKEKEEVRKNWLESKDLKSVQSFSSQVDEPRGEKELSSLSLRERAAYFHQKLGNKELEKPQRKQSEKNL